VYGFDLFFFEKMMDWAKGREGKKEIMFLYCSMPTIKNYVHIYNVGDRKSFGQYIYNRVFFTLQLTNLIVVSSCKYSGCILIVFF